MTDTTIREALDWALRELRGSTGYKHPAECSPLDCVCGWKRAADALDAALAAPRDPAPAPALDAEPEWWVEYRVHESQRYGDPKRPPTTIRCRDEADARHTLDVYAATAAFLDGRVVVKTAAIAAEYAKGGG